MVKVKGFKGKDGKYDCTCVKLRSFDPAFDNPNSPPSSRPVRIQDPQDPTRTIPYNNMSRPLQQQVLDGSNRQLQVNQQQATPNAAPTETANDQHVPAEPHHSLPSSDAIQSQRPSTPLNLSANGDLMQAGAAIYTSPTRNSQSPHQQQPHSLVQAQSPTAGQGYSQSPGLGRNSSLYSNLGSLPQQLNGGNRMPQLGTILYQQAIRDGYQEELSPDGPRFTNPNTGAVYDTDPRYPCTLAEKEFFEGEGYRYPEHTAPFFHDIDRLGVSDFEWPSNSDVLAQGFGSIPVNGINRVTLINGTNGTTPMNGTNGATPTNGASGAAPMNGSNGATPTNGTNGAGTMNGTNRATPINGTNGATPVNGIHGQTFVNGTRSSAALNALSSSSNCECGPGCNCVYCAAHPYNPATRARVQELGQIIESDFLRHPHPDSLPPIDAPLQFGYGGIRMNGGPSNQIPHTMRNSDYYTLRYPMEHSNNQTCTGVSATCPCNSDCTCVGCLTHAGQH